MPPNNHISNVGQSGRPSDTTAGYLVTANTSDSVIVAGNMCLINVCIIIVVIMIIIFKPCKKR